MNWPANTPAGLSKDDVVELNRRFEELDTALGFEISDDFLPFSQRNDVFSRAFWDETVRSKDAEDFYKSYRMKFATRRGEGFSQKDFALRNAAWSVSTLISSRGMSKGLREGFLSPVADDTPISNTRIDVDDPALESAEIKKLAKLFGADIVGITEVDPRWHYANRVDARDFSEAPNELPDDITHVIVMGHSMDADLVDTYPSALAGASTGLEYSHEAAIVVQLSTYIRNLGFQAVGSMNDTALVIPYAIKAGLGEYGCNQMVLTPEFGPRVRFSKIFTNLPLVADKPKPLGIKQYCDTCTKCADACPPRALPFGPANDTPVNRSTLGHVKKWSADCEKCFGYWAKLKTDCAICMRVCPFNRRDTWHERLWFALATSRWNKIAHWWDERRGATTRLKAKDWWDALRQGDRP